MSWFKHLQVWLVAVGLLHLVLPARAAEPTKYLLDDTDFVLRVDSKQILAAPMYKKHYQKQAEDLVKMEVVQTILKDSGFDPLKDVDLILVISGRSCHQADVKGDNGAVAASSGGGPFVIIQGRFDPAKLQAKAQQVAKDMKILKVQKVGDTQLWQIGEGFGAAYVAVLDKETAVFSTRKEQVTDAIEKAAGKKKTVVKDKEMQLLLTKFDPKLPVQWAATGDMITSTSVSVRSNNGQTVAEVKHTTLKDSGLMGLSGSITCGDELKFQMTFTAADADKAKDKAKELEDNLKQMAELIKQFADQKKELAPVIDALKTVKFTAKDKSILVEAQAKPEAIGALIQVLITAR